MSLNLTVTIPPSTASILRKAHDFRTADAEVDSALFTVANAVIDAVKAFPWSITTLPRVVVENESRSFSPYGVLTPPSPDYSKDSSERYMSGRPLPEFSSASEVSSRSTSASTPYEGSAVSGESESWWSATEWLCDDFSIDICDIVDGQEEIHYLSVHGSMTLEEIMYRVEQVSGVPKKDMRLVWRGYRLNQPDTALSTYGITSGSKLHLLRRAPSITTLPDSLTSEPEPPFSPSCGYEITIQTVGGKHIPVLVLGETTTAELASHIFDRQGICPGMQRLVHRGKVVFDGWAYDAGEACVVYTLEELGIGPETIVSLYLCNTQR